MRKSRVQLSALGQAVAVANGDTAGIGVAHLLVFVHGVGSTQLTWAQGSLHTDAVQIHALVVATLGSDQHHGGGHAKVVRRTQVEVLVVHGVTHLATFDRAIGTGHIQRAIGIAHAQADGARQAVVARLFTKAIGDLAVHAAQLGQQVAHAVRNALGVGAFRGTCSRAADEVVAIDATHAGVAKGVEGFQVLVARGLVAAQAHFTEVAHHAHRGAAIELEAGATVIDVDAAFEPKACLQATTEVFLATKAQAAAGVAAIGQAVHALAIADFVFGRDICNGDVSHTKKGHAGALGRGSSGASSSHEGKECSFHAV